MGWYAYCSRSPIASTASQDFPYYRLRCHVIIMIDFNKSPILGIITYGILLLSCLLEISVELGLHEFEAFASHHGLAIFAVGSL